VEALRTVADWKFKGQPTTQELRPPMDFIHEVEKSCRIRSVRNGKGIEVRQTLMLERSSVSLQFPDSSGLKDFRTIQEAFWMAWDSSTSSAKSWSFCGIISALNRFSGWTSQLVFKRSW